MKVGMVSPYLDTLGGGERYFLSVAEFFQNRGNQVDIFNAGTIGPGAIKARFDLNLSKVNLLKTEFYKRSFLDKIKITQNYDLFFFLSDGSIPSSLAKKNILLFQEPFHFSNQKTLINKIKLSRVSTVLCYSQFVKNHIDQTFGIQSRVLYPPIDIDKFQPVAKENLILSVGRFGSHPHSKNQEILIETFKNLISKGLKNWRLAILGGARSEDQAIIDKLKGNSKGYSIEVISNGDFDLLKNYYSKAKIYWHAAGFGQDLENFPEKAEHFGITTVEAMAAGCVPIVYKAGGQMEIVNENINGFFWQTIEDLLKTTNNLIHAEKNWQKLSTTAVNSAQKFSKESFFKNLSRIVPEK